MSSVRLINSKQQPGKLTPAGRIASIKRTTTIITKTVMKG